MKLANHDLLAALRLRYDHYSAQSMFETVLARAGLDDLPAYDAAQIAAFRAALARVGDRLQQVDARLDMLLDAGGSPPPVVVEPPKPAEPPLAPGIHETGPIPDIATTITLAGLDTEDGDHVLVCGGLPALGNWDPEKAAAMKREGAYWMATIAVPPGTAVPFKFLHRTADGTVIWEDGDNRQLVPKPRIEATWR